jgi:cobalt-zinc-cadmium efflux system protein
MGHDHGVPRTAGARHRRRLVVVLGITLGILAVEVVGAVVTDSLALLADAGHVLTDAAGVLLAVLAVTLAARPSTPRRSFGLYRLEILAALVNALLLFGIAAFILWEAWQRWSEPPDVRAGGMIAFAVVGMVGNLVCLLLLRDGARQSLNVRGAYLEVLGDLLGSAAVIAAGAIILVTGWQRADVVASVAVALMILPRTWSLLRESVDVLLEATPRGVDLTEVRAHILGTRGVVGLHDLHVWTLTSGMPVMSAHVVLSDTTWAEGGGGRVLDDLGVCLADHFDVEHCTFQLEPQEHATHEGSRHD